MTDIAETRNVSVIGIGQMGGGIAKNLDNAELLSGVYDASSDQMSSLDFSDAVIRGPLDKVAEVSEFVIFVVPSSKQIVECLEGRKGLLANARPSTVYLDFTTSDPQETLEVAQLVQEKGMHYLDCGMSGGGRGADTGQLTLMIGGDKDQIERCSQLISVIANVDNVFHVGQQGAGHTMKLIHNMVCHSNFFVLCEAGRLAEESGIPLQTAINVINAGNARSLISEQRFPNHILSGTWDARSTVSNLAKDLNMGVEHSKKLGRPAVFAGETLRLLKDAMGSDLSGEDFSTLYRCYDDLMQNRWKNLEES